MKWQPAAGGLLLCGLILSCHHGDKNPAVTTDTVVQSDTMPRVDPVMTPPADTMKNEFAYLRDYAGKYPAEVKLLEDTRLKPRLLKMMGDRFSFMEKYWAVEMPLEIKGNMFVANACMAHNCGITDFIIVVDLAKGLVYSGIREEGKVNLYAEDGSGNIEIDNWVTGN